MRAPIRSAGSGRRVRAAGGQQTAGPAWLPAVPALITLGVVLYQIGRPSLWQDEVSTLSDTNRTLPEIFRLLGNLDAVHGAYYLLMWAEERVAGTSVLALRLPSAVGMAVAAGLITMLGQRLVSAGAGLASGLVFAALPQVSWYGQDARDIALDTALATAASYLFVRALEGGPHRRRWLIGYGAVLSVLGPFNFFCLLLVAAHGVTLIAARVRWRAATPAALPARGWLAAVTAAVAVTSPVVVIGWRQRGQISWIKPPDAATAGQLGRLIGPPGLLVTLAVVLLAAAGVSAWGGRARLRRDWPWLLVALTVPWLVLPTVLLLAASLIHPVFITRYVVFCLPAAALLAGAGVAALGRVAGLAGLAAIVVTVLPAQAAVRAPDGHGQNLRAISHFLGTHARRGDPVLFASRYIRKIEIAYPAGYRGLRDISLGESAVRAGQPEGLSVPQAVLRQRLLTVTRLWVIATTRSRAFLPPGLGLRLVRHWDFAGGYRIRLYVRPPASGRQTVTPPACRTCLKPVPAR